MTKTSKVSILAGLALTASLSLAAIGTFAQGPQVQQGPIKMNPNITYLKCEPQKSDVAALVKVTNISNQDFGPSAIIHAQNGKGYKADVTLNAYGRNGLKKNESITFALNNSSWTDSASCTAYAKK